MDYEIANTFYRLSLGEKTDEEITDYPTPIFNFSPDSEKKLKMNEYITPIFYYSPDFEENKKRLVPNLLLSDSSLRQKKRTYSRSIYDKDDQEEISPDSSPIFGILKGFSDKKKRRIIKKNKKVAFEILNRNNKDLNDDIKYIN